MTALDRAAVAAVDSTGQMDEVLGLAEHLTDALWRFDSAGARPVDAAGGVIVAGMGGSASGGRLAIGALGSRLSRPLVVSDGYALPGWAGPSDARVRLELLGQHRGDAGRLRRRRRARRAADRRHDGRRAGRARARETACRSSRSRAASSRGRRSATRSSARWRRPRWAARRRPCGARSRRRRRWSSSWSRSGARTAPRTRWRSRSRGSLHGTVPVIAGAELAAAAAYRWKCQFNENASLPAFASVLPEADHNEVVGWDAAAGRSAGSPTSRWRTRARIRATRCGPG